MNNYFYFWVGFLSFWFISYVLGIILSFSRRDKGEDEVDIQYLENLCNKVDYKLSSVLSHCDVIPKGLPENSEETEASVGANPLTDMEQDFYSGSFYSILDGFIFESTKMLDRSYDSLDKLKPGKHDKRIAALENQIMEYRSIVAVCSFIQTHGLDAYLKYLRTDGSFFRDEIIERSFFKSEDQSEDKP